MKQRTSQILFAYWNEVRAGRIAPRRFEIEPSRIGSILSETFILERVHTIDRAGSASDVRSVYRYRLAGTKLCEQFGDDFRGRDFLDDWDVDDRAALEQTLTGMSDRGGVGIVTFEASSQLRPGPTKAGSTSAGKPGVGNPGASRPHGTPKRLTFEAVLLPLIHTSDSLDRFLGCMSPIAEPAWLGSERLVEKSLLRCELIWPDGRPFPVVEKSRQQTPFLAEIRNARLVRSERRQFRVYDGGLSKTPPGNDH
jgi:hypothetical protein